MRRAKVVLAIVAASAVVVAAVVYVALRQSAGTPPTAPPSGSSIPATARPFGDSAPWNVPVAGLAPDPRSNDWRDRFWWNSIGNADAAHPERNPDRGHFGVVFGLGDADADFAVPLYSAADATTTRRVRQRAGWPGGWNLGPDDHIPWNPGWRPSRGSDAKAVVIDPATGREWGLWGLVAPDEDGGYDDGQCLGHAVGAGYDRATDLCAGGATLTVDPTGAPIDYRTYTGNDPKARGSGIPELAMLTRPEEVRSGAIRHALSILIYNTMAGPKCGPEVEDTTGAGFGDTCGDAVAPAGQLESENHAKGCGPDTERGDSDRTRRKRAVPDGMRFALRLSDADIDSWLDSRHYEGQLRETARVFAVALRDYGWFVTGTSCYAATFIAAGASNPTTAKLWRELGIQGDGRDLLYGLLTRRRIVAIEPATNECADGTTSHFACPAAITRY
jgi:hypothetical protein